MVVNIPQLAEGKEVHAILTMEVTRHTLLPPDNTDLYVVPDAKTLPPEFKQYLSPSPLIESNHAADQGDRQATRRGSDQGLAPRPRDLRLGPQDDPVSERRPAHRLLGSPRQGPRRLQPVDLHVHRHLPGQRHSRPHRPDPRTTAIRNSIFATTRGGGIGFRPRSRARRISAASSRIRRFCRRATPSRFPCPERGPKPSACCQTISRAPI